MKIKIMMMLAILMIGIAGGQSYQGATTFDGLITAGAGIEMGGSNVTNATAISTSYLSANAIAAADMVVYVVDNKIEAMYRNGTVFFSETASFENNNSAIQAAVDRSGPNARKIFISGEIYKTSSIDCSGVESMILSGGTIRQMDDSPALIIDSRGYSFSKFSDMEIYMDSSVNATSALIDINNTAIVDFENMYIWAEGGDFPRRSVNISNHSEWIRFSGGQLAGAVDIDGSSDIYFDGTWFNNYYNSAGVDLNDGSMNIVFTGCHFIGTTVWPFGPALSMDSVYFNTVTGCNFDGGDGSVDMGEAIHLSDSHANIIAASKIINWYDYPVLIRASDFNSFVGNTFYNCLTKDAGGTETDIQIDGGSKYNTFTDSTHVVTTVRNNGHAAIREIDYLGTPNYNTIRGTKYTYPYYYAPVTVGAQSSVIP